MRYGLLKISAVAILFGASIAVSAGDAVKKPAVKVSGANQRLVPVAAQNKVTRPFSELANARKGAALSELLRASSCAAAYDQLDDAVESAQGAHGLPIFTVLNIQADLRSAHYDCFQSFTFPPVIDEALRAYTVSQNSSTGQNEMIWSDLHKCKGPFTLAAYRNCFPVDRIEEMKRLLIEDARTKGWTLAEALNPNQRINSEGWAFSLPEAVPYILYDLYDDDEAMIFRFFAGYQDALTALNPGRAGNVVACINRSADDFANACKGP